MDPFDTPLFEPPADTGEDEKKLVDPFDIFGDGGDDDMFNTKPSTGTAKSGISGISVGAAKSGDDFFNMGGDEDDGIAGFMAMGKSISSGGSAHAQDLDDLFGPPPTSFTTAVDKSRRQEGEFADTGANGGGVSLFEDLLDFTPSSATVPGATTQSPSSLLDLDGVPPSQSEASTSKSEASNSDWLFGDDDAVDASKSKSASEAATQQQRQGLAELSSSDSNTSGKKPGEESTEPLNVLVTAPSMDVDQDMDEVKDAGSRSSPEPGEKTDEEKEGDGEKELSRGLKTSVSSDVSDKGGSSRNSSTSDFDLDFSVLELPSTAHLNFDLSNHKRTLSKKGSFSLRKKPTRAAIHSSKLATSEDSMFVDSTEPRPCKSPLEDVEDEQPARKREAEVPREESPSRPAKKAMGGMKIPGLLEGLMGSKRFNKNENKQATISASSKQPAPSSTSTTTKSSPLSKPSTEISEDSSLSKPSPPVPAARSKPMALPRVLPILPGKPLKSVGKDSPKNSEETESSSTGLLSKKTEKTVHNTQPSSLKKDADATALPISPLKDAKTSMSSTSAKDTNSTSSLTPSRVLPSIGSADSKKLSPGEGNEKSDVRKKPPTVMKKPSLKGRPDKPAASDEKSNAEDTKLGSVFNKPSVESKFKENLLSSSKPISDNKPPAECKPATENIPASTKEETKSQVKTDVFHPILKSPDSKNDFKPAEEKVREETSVAIVKPDSKDNAKADLKEFQTTAATRAVSPLKETDNKIPTPEKIPSQRSKGEDISAVEKPVSTSLKKTPLGLSKPSPFSSSNKPSFLAKPNITKPKPEPPSKPPSSTPPRKSSVSSVKPPSSTDKSSSKTSGSPAGNMGRRDSITGSAYNPIGFKSTLGTSDSSGDSRSRGSSVSSDIKTRRDSVSSIGSDIIKKDLDLNLSGGSTKVPADSPASDDDKVEVILREKPETTESKPSWLTEANKNSLNKAKRPDVAEKTKEAADEANKIIKDQGSLRKASVPTKPSSTSSAKSDTVLEDKKSSSPWGVRLRKVDSSRPKSVVEPTNNENSSPGHNWRQQMSLKRQSFVPPKELEKPTQQDSTPEWAKASLQRRQRLLDAGVINSEAK